MMRLIYSVLIVAIVATAVCAQDDDLLPSSNTVEIQFPPSDDDASEDSSVHATPSVVNTNAEDEDLGSVTMPVAPINPFVNFLKAQAEERERHALEMPAVAIRPMPALLKMSEDKAPQNPFIKFLRMQHEEKQQEHVVNPFEALVNSLRRLRVAAQRAKNGGVEDPAHVSTLSRGVDADDTTPQIIMPTFPNLGRMFRNIFEQKLQGEYSPIFSRTFQMGDGNVVSIQGSFEPLVEESAEPLPLIFQRVAEGLKGFRQRLRQLIQRGERDIKSAADAKLAASQPAVAPPAKTLAEVQAQAEADKAHPCRADARQLCADKMAVSRLATLLCLNSNQDKLSDTCKASVKSCPAFQCSGDVARLCPSAASHQQVAECLHLNAAKLSAACVRTVKKHKKAEVKAVVKAAKAQQRFRPQGAMGSKSSSALHSLLSTHGATSSQGQPEFKLFGVLPLASAIILGVGIMALLAVAVCLHAQSRRQQKTEMARKAAVAAAAAPVTDVETLIGAGARVERNNSGFEGGVGSVDAPNAIVIN